MVLAPNTYRSVQFVTAAVHNVPGGESGLVVRLHPCREGTSEPEPVRVGCVSNSLSVVVHTVTVTERASELGAIWVR